MAYTLAAPPQEPITPAIALEDIALAAGGLSDSVAKMS